MEFWDWAIFPWRVLVDWIWGNPGLLSSIDQLQFCDGEFQEPKENEAVSCHGYNGVACPAR